MDERCDENRPVLEQRMWGRDHKSNGLWYVDLCSIGRFKTCPITLYGKHLLIWHRVSRLGQVDKGGAGTKAIGC